MVNQPKQTTRSRWRRAGYRGAQIVVAAGSLAVIATCSDDRGDTSALIQALAPKTNEVLANADSPAKYATACGLGDDPDVTLPALGTADAPIRGTTDTDQEGKLTSYGWTLLKHFDASPADLAVSTDKMANLWRKTKGGRDWYYLYRYTDPDPTKAQNTLNGILGFNATSICAFDNGSAATPPVDMTALYYAGQLDNKPDQMDDCSNCHVAGYIAPRKKSYGVAKRNKWLPQWTTYSAAFGPVWELGQATSTDLWTSGAGAALVTPPKECQEECHESNWVPARNRDKNAYCDAVFAAAFDTTNGVMFKTGNTFADSTTCTKFIYDIGCGDKRTNGGADLTTLCPLPPAPPAAPAPMVNDIRMQIQRIEVVSSTAVDIVPMHNPDLLWDFAGTTSPGDPWVDTLQVWGGRYPGSTTSPMGPTVTVDPDALPPSLSVTGLTPGATYQFQLQMGDTDGAMSFEPLATVTMPGIDMEPAGDTMAGALLSGTQAVFTLGTVTLRCNASSISGTIPATGNPGDPVNVALGAPVFTSCVAQLAGISVAVTVTTNSANGSFLVEDGCANNGPAFHIPQGGATFTAHVLGATCTIAVAGAVDVPATWTNGSPSTLAISGSVPVSTSGGFPCPSATSATFSASYAVTDVTAPGANVTVTRSCGP